MTSRQSAQHWSKQISVIRSLMTSRQVFTALVTTLVMTSRQSVQHWSRHDRSSVRRLVMMSGPFVQHGRSGLAGALLNTPQMNSAPPLSSSHFDYCPLVGELKSHNAPSPWPMDNRPRPSGVHPQFYSVTLRTHGRAWQSFDVLRSHQRQCLKSYFVAESRLHSARLYSHSHQA